MPKLGLTMTEGTVANWLKSEGDPIAVGEKIFDVETDKLTNTVEATVAGTLLRIVVAQGGKVPCMAPVGIVGEPDEDISAVLAGVEAGAGSTDDKAGGAGAQPTQKGEGAPAAASAAAATAPEGRVVASPAAKKLAKEKSIDLSTVTGTGPGGRITVEDVEIALTAPPSAKASGLAKKIAAEQGVDLTSVESQDRIMAADVLAASASASAAAGFEMREVITPMSGMRRIIAQRMRESVDISPTVTFNISVDVTALKKLRADLASEGRKASFTDLLAYSVSRLLIDFPLLNCRIEGDNIVTRNYVNLGIAVALDDGLLVPVVTNAHLLSLTELSQRIKALAESARGGSLSLDALTGGSFTITNLGMFGMESFSPIINQPEVAILGVNAITETPVVIDGEVQIRPLMRLSLTTDHRAVDGSVAAQFLAQLKKLLEKPSLLL